MMWLVLTAWLTCFLLLSHLLYWQYERGEVLLADDVMLVVDKDLKIRTREEVLIRMPSGELKLGSI